MEKTEGHQCKAEETAASDAWVAMPCLGCHAILGRLYMTDGEPTGR